LSESVFYSQALHLQSARVKHHEIGYVQAPVPDCWLYTSPKELAKDKRSSLILRNLQWRIKSCTTLPPDLPTRRTRRRRSFAVAATRPSFNRIFLRPESPTDQPENPSQTETERMERWVTATMFFWLSSIRYQIFVVILH